MKTVGGLLVVLALLIGVVPQFTDCLADGRMLTLEGGRQIPMKCHWTAMAEIGVAIPLLATGVLIAISKRRDTRRTLGILGAVLGAVTILLPTSLIGVCANPDMICLSFMKPALMLMGSVVIALNAYVVVQSVVKTEELEAATQRGAVVPG